MIAFLDSSLHWHFYSHIRYLPYSSCTLVLFLLPYSCAVTYLLFFHSRTVTAPSLSRCQLLIVFIFLRSRAVDIFLSRYYLLLSFCYLLPYCLDTYISPVLTTWFPILTSSSLGPGKPPCISNSRPMLTLSLGPVSASALVILLLLPHLFVTLTTWILALLHSYSHLSSTSSTLCE